MSGPDIRASYDVAVLGAGPAGLAAAADCARAGLSTVLFDEQAAPGGQVYRAITETPLARQSVLGTTYWQGRELVDGFQSSGAQYVPGATVWSLTREREIGVSVNGRAVMTQARRVIVCTGAVERPFPIPGWTLPGVMTAGAAQILLKSSGVVPSGRTVLAGCGPLLWLLAWQYLNAGVTVDALLDTTASANRIRALAHLPAFVLSPYFREGLALMRAVKRAVRVIPGVTALRAVGKTHVEQVVYRMRDGSEASLPVDTLLLHQGVVPHVNLAMAAGVGHRWDDRQLCWAPVLSGYGDTSVDDIAIAGDGAGIAGAQAARWRGVLAGIAARRALGCGVSPPEERAARSALARALRGRAFLDVLYRPADGFRRPEGETIACRCEEVTAREIVETAALGCPGPNQMKSFLRCGMGPCQGRMCGLTVTELIAGARGLPPQAVGHYRLRPPVKPITVGELAGLPQTEAAVRAVVRS